MADDRLVLGIAVHESAHAVVGALRGVPLDCVTITGSRKNNVCKLGRLAASPTPIDLAGRIQFYFAGGAATELTGLLPPDDGCDNDLRNARDCIRRLETKCTPALETYWRDVTRKVVRAVTPEIEKVAAALLRRRRLSGEEITRLIHA